MGYRRRGVLGLIGACAGLGAVGSARKQGPSSQSAAADVANQPEATSSDVVSQAEPTDDSETPNDGEGTPSGLATRTANVMDELSWFASEHEDAVAAFRDAADDVLAAVSDHGETIRLSDTVVERLDGETDRPRLDRGWPYDIWWDEGERRWRYADVDWQRPTDEVTDETPLSARAVNDLRTQTNIFVDTFETELDPHFTGLAEEEQFATETMDTIAAFNDRGDVAMVVAGLVRLHEHYAALSSAGYVEDSLSDGPIRNRLADYLKSPASTNTTALFEVDYRGGSDTHSAFAYDSSVGSARRAELNRGEPLATIDGSTDDTGGIRLQDAVGELSVSEDRVDRCYVLVNEWERPGDSYYSAELSSQPIFVQRYSSEAAANDAYDQLLDREDIDRAAVDVQLGESGATPWTGIYFPHQGQPWSAAIRRSGRYLLVAGVARRPLEQRDEAWTEPLELAWVWSENA